MRIQRQYHLVLLRAFEGALREAAKREHEENEQHEKQQQEWMQSMDQYAEELNDGR